jgi:predicted small metal-binding protein
VRRVAAHAKAVHNLETMTEEVVEKVRQVMRDE